MILSTLSIVFGIWSAGRDLWSMDLVVLSDDSYVSILVLTTHEAGTCVTYDNLVSLSFYQDFRRREYV